MDGGTAHRLCNIEFIIIIIVVFLTDRSNCRPVEPFWSSCTCPRCPVSCACRSDRWCTHRAAMRWAARLRSMQKSLGSGWNWKRVFFLFMQNQFEWAFGGGKSGEIDCNSLLSRWPAVACEWARPDVLSPPFVLILCQCLCEFQLFPFSFSQLCVRIATLIRRFDGWDCVGEIVF